MWNPTKKSMKKFKRQNSLFLQWEVSSSVLKTWKTMKTKTRITQNFQILYHIQGTTMWKSKSRAFRKCGTFWVYDFLKGSYWLSKFSHFSIFFNSKMRRCKKKTRPKFWFFGVWWFSSLMVERHLKKVWLLESPTHCPFIEFLKYVESTSPIWYAWKTFQESMLTWITQPLSCCWFAKVCSTLLNPSLCW